MGKHKGILGISELSVTNTFVCHSLMRTLLDWSYFWISSTAGLQITNRQAPVTLSGQTCVCSDTARFWPVKF